MNKRTKAWLMYDWANSAYVTTMTAAVLPIFYANVAAADLAGHVATSYWGLTQTAANILLMLLMPIVGAAADYSGRKLTLMRILCYMGIASSLLFVFVGEGDYLFASAIFIIGLIGLSGGNTLYDSMLSDLVPAERRDYISALGYSYGYIGGGIMLVLNLMLIQKPQWFGLAEDDTLTATRICFVLVAIWWFVFSLPLFRQVKTGSSVSGMSVGQYASIGFSRLRSTFRGIRRYPQLLKFLLAYWLFNDGITTIITMATIYGDEIGIGQSDLIAALVLTQFIGFPCTILLGKLAGRIGAKAALYASLSVYVVIVALGYFMSEPIHFYALACLVGLVQGGSQAIARSIYSKLTPAGRSAEFFGFLNISDKFSAIIGPLVFSAVGLLTGSSRLGILALLSFFILGMLMLSRVDIEKGREEAAAAG